MLKKIKLIYLLNIALALSVFLLGACKINVDITESYEGASQVEVRGTQLYVDGEPFYIKGVCWNPVSKGGSHPEDLSFEDFVELDSQLMSEAGINTVRTYEPITDKKVLDILYSKGIYVINTVYTYGGDSVQTAADNIKEVKDHPAILMWNLGNEWNYNGLYVSDSFEVSINKINEAASLIKDEDLNHPVVTVYGGIPNENTINQMPDIDGWGLNIYGGLNFGPTFAAWSKISDKPMFMAEYGADAWDWSEGSLNLKAQAYAAKVLTEELMENSSADNPENVCLGGTIFEFADEWWKDENGSPSEHDTGGIAPGIGPYPDNTFNEEYWGICDIDRNTRPAYDELKKLYKSN